MDHKRQFDPPTYDATKLIAWFRANYEPGRPHVANARVHEHYEADTGDYSFTQQEFPKALRDAGIPVERTSARRLIIRGYKRKVGA